MESIGCGQRSLKVLHVIKKQPPESTRTVHSLQREEGRTREYPGLTMRFGMRLKAKKKHTSYGKVAK